MKNRHWLLLILSWTSFGLVVLFGFITCLTATRQQRPKEAPTPNWPVVSIRPIDLESIPPDWTAAPVHFQWTVASESEFTKIRDLVRRELDKYAPCMLANVLSSVEIAGELHFSGVSAGGTAGDDRVFIACSSANRQISDDHIVLTLHSEVASLFFRRFHDRFPAEWAQFLPPEFEYGTGGVNAILKGNDSQFMNQSDCHDGFLYQYGRASLEEDVCSFRAMQLAHPTDLASACRACALIRKKNELSNIFWKSIENAQCGK
jgi:hypothetical protein